MVSISFDYNDWDNKVDVPLERPGTTRGFAVVQGGLRVGKAPSVNQGEQSPIIGDSISSVVELLAGCIEWCREYGLEAGDLQSKVRSYMKRNRGSKSSQLLLNAERELNEISDPRNRLRKITDPAKQYVA